MLIFLCSFRHSFRHAFGGFFRCKALVNNTLKTFPPFPPHTSNLVYRKCKQSATIMQKIFKCNLLKNNKL
nr:MAG TPA: hypothetical protein [Caudoviricetes sp.]